MDDTGKTTRGDQLRLESAADLVGEDALQEQGLGNVQYQAMAALGVNNTVGLPGRHDGQVAGALDELGIGHLDDDGALDLGR